MGHMGRQSDAKLDSPVKETKTMRSDEKLLPPKKSPKIKMSETQRDNSNSFVIQKSNEHIQSLTPVDVVKIP